MPKALQPIYTVYSRHSSLVLDCGNNGPAILYWGPRLGDSTSPEMLKQLATQQEAPACPPQEAAVSLSPELGAGFQGNAGIQIHRRGLQWAVSAQIESVTRTDESHLTIVSICQGTQIKITHRIGLDADTDVLTASTELCNIGDSSLSVEQCNAPCIPVPMDYNKILGFEGRWAKEFQRHSVDRFMGAYVQENRAGRTSHDAFPGVIIHTEQTSERIGAAYGLHLGWSGNHHIRIEEQFTGRAYAQLGELFFPGELSLEPNQSYCSPVLYGASTHNGFSALSGCFHRYIRSHLTDERMAGKAKPVHFNTWEAMYFDLSLERLQALADSAAEVGAERFVLDDGWFKSRKSDRAGLGDWTVDQTVFPDGLSPLIDHVQAKGMEFGLWIEPEMVNPDSDLYRAHPDWILSTPPAPLILARHQLVLDLTRPEVQDYLFNCIDALLCQYPIAYLKWDMNRVNNQPGNTEGRAVTHYQTLALYQLLARVRGAYPMVEIESCSSGGGRADFGILAYTDRIWPSDSNDALDRMAIQKGFSMFFPAEFMGAHVGPKDCHITGRSISMATRAGVALFGDMGIEANLLEMEDEEKSELATAVALHKQHRELIHAGDLVRLDTSEYENSFGIVAANQQEALFSYALLNSPSTSAMGRLRLCGLDANRLYTLSIIWPSAQSSTSSSIIDVINGSVVSGDALMNFGLQLPIMQPTSLLILHLQS
ncbi:MAG: alpha-galactosidase [Porticoccaceae bacterium]|nr:alpha-galactosidase [Porticoccaceae bacterium]